MNDNEIIKALECCGRESCNGCPYRNGKCHQGNPMIRDALDLINRLQAENEDLKKALNITLDDLASEYDNKIKSEARKEFAERVKTEFYYEFDEIIPSVMAEKIDNLLEEMEKKDE